MGYNALSVQLNLVDWTKYILTFSILLNELQLNSIENLYLILQFTMVIERYITDKSCGSFP